MADSRTASYTARQIAGVYALMTSSPA